jgi:DNA-binding IscR family transcriptional regulator
MNKDTRLSDVLHVLLHLGQAQQPLTSEVLARALKTNPAVFRRTMAGLREAGYVQSGKGHGGGWTLARPLCDIILYDVYTALGNPGLFAIGTRNDEPNCLVEKAVNEALLNTMDKAQALFMQRFKEIKLNTLNPKTAVIFAAQCG